jgi:hypothetical protein
MVIELPPNDANVNFAAMYRSMFHRQPLVNAHTATSRRITSVVPLPLERRPSVLTFLASERPLVILVNDHVDPNHGFATRSLRCLVGAVGISSAGSTFLLPAQARLESAAVGPALAASVRDGTRPSGVRSRRVEDDTRDRISAAVAVRGSGEAAADRGVR